MPEFPRIFRPFEIELQFDAGLVTMEHFQTLLNPAGVTQYQIGSAVNPDVRTEACVRLFQTMTDVPNGEPRPHHFSFFSPTYPASPQSISQLSTLLSHLNWNRIEGHPSPITKKCSFILNFKVEDLTLLEIYTFIRFASKIESAILKLQPPSRRRDSILKTINSQLSTELPSGGDEWSREREFFYKSQVASSKSAIRYVPSKGLISISYAAGTSNISKIFDWIYLWNAILERSCLRGAPEAEIGEPRALMDYLGWPAEGRSPLARARAALLDRAESIRQRQTQALLGRR